MTRVLGGRAVVAAVAACLLVGLVPGVAGAVTRTVVVTTASAQPQVAFRAFDGNPPKAFDVDGDGRREILAQNDNDYLYVLDGTSGAKLAELKTTFPAGWSARTFNGPEAYRDAANVTHLVLTNSAAYVTSYRHDANGSTPTSLRFVKEWERRTTDCHANPGMDAKPTLADLDRDRTFEIVVAVEESGIVALRSDGSLYWRKCIGGGNAEATAGDLNLDGWPEVVHGSDAGVVTAMNGRTGATVWSYYAPGHFTIGPGSMPVGVAIGQVDGVGGLDVVVGARDAHNATNFTENHALLLALSSGGSLLWGRQDPTGNPLTYTRPIIADADGDGQNEVYWADWNTMGHKPPPENSPDAWKVMGPGNYYRYSRTGDLVWKQTLGSYWSNKDIALVDLDGDGRQEVLANGPNGGHDGIWSLNASSGAKEQFVDLYPWMMTRQAVAYDLAGDGGMDLVVQVGPQATSQGPAVHVYDTGVPFNAAWPHLPDAVLGVPPPPPPPPNGTFSATFTVKSPNAWWQEVTVQPTPSIGKPVTKVQVRFPGHDWQPMTKASWGAWTSSYNTPAGTPVEFLASTADNWVSQSLPFTWMDGTLSRGSVPPGGTTSSSTSTGSSTSPPPTTSSSSSTTSSSTSSSSPPGSEFQGTFATVRGNEWWVQSQVWGNNAGIAEVHARVNGGTWRPLTMQSWGDNVWAASFHIPQGALVQLRATSTDHTTDLSDQCYQWIPPSNQNAVAVDCPAAQAFSATFHPVAVGNDWWVEARVSANEPVAAVHVMFGSSGTWQPLDLQSWGNWAKSLHTPNGTPVNFRATSSDGDVALSPAPTIWT